MQNRQLTKTDENEKLLAESVINFLTKFPYNMKQEHAEKMLAELPHHAISEVKKIVQLGYALTPNTIRFYLAIKQILLDISDTDIMPLDTIKQMLDALLKKLYDITYVSPMGAEITRDIALFIVDIIDHHAYFKPHEKIALYEHLMWQPIFDHQTTISYYANRALTIFSSTKMLSEAQRTFQAMRNHLQQTMNPPKHGLKK